MAYYLGAIFGVIIGSVLGIVVFLKYTKTDNSIRCKYDERQQLVRGIGFKYGFFTVIIYDIVAAIFMSYEKKQYIDHATLMFSGVLISAFIYAVYCIWNEGYFSLNENPKRVAIVFAAVALLNFGVGYRSFLHGLLIEDGMLTFKCINIFCGILMLMLFLVMAAKRISKEKEEK